jgi:uncharacterized RDD family membrane protein YckC
MRQDRSMTEIPAGWYPDPAPGQPGEPPSLRYWDGQRWTEHVHAPAGYRPGPAYPGESYAGAAYPGQSYGDGVLVAGATTPDGQPLAGWWARVLAYLIDGLVLTVLSLLAAAPFLSRLAKGYDDLVREVTNGTGGPGLGASGVDQQQALSDMLLPLVGFAAVSLLVNFVYNVVFLRWKQATPGKLVLGLRVRRRELPGTLPWRTILLRWIGQNWTGFLALVPVVGVPAAVYPLLDDLWPLWDDKRQALHDKVAGTNVVRR